MSQMELKNKRVLVVGLGKGGLAAALFLRNRGARVTVSDTRSSKESIWNLMDGFVPHG
jgi:UDP-N-acetylmuramoylalanine--D-glutamate ligase